jgi:hypothetical protein
MLTKGCLKLFSFFSKGYWNCEELSSLFVNKAVQSTQGLMQDRDKERPQMTMQYGACPLRGG